MPRNIEIKARIESCQAIEARVAALANSAPVVMKQDDTFFVCPNGRLKLRELAENKGELIFYQRANKTEPKESFYVISLTDNPARLREVLSLAYGTCGRVRKNRTVYMIDNTRVHLDKVEELGEFLEFEVVLSEAETPDHGIDIANALLDKLDISRNALIEGAYVDLIVEHKAKT